MRMSDIWASVKNTFSAQPPWQQYMMKLGFSAARADGPINAKEEERLMAQAKVLLHENPSDENLAHLFKLGLESSMAPEENIQVFMQAAKPPDVWFSSMSWLLSVMAADGDLNDEEANWLMRFHSATGVENSYLADIAGYFLGRDNNGGQGSVWHSVLNVAPDADLETIKRAYRQKASEFHPDKLSGVSEGVRKLAEEKLKEINEAYRRLNTQEQPNGLQRQLAIVDEASCWRLLDSVRAGQVAICPHCAQNNRLPEREKAHVARCGACHAYLALTERQAELICHLFESPFDPSLWHQEQERTG